MSARIDQARADYRNAVTDLMAVIDRYDINQRTKAQWNEVHAAEDRCDLAKLKLARVKCEETSNVHG